MARKAAERGLIAADAVEAIDMARAVELLFHPGFSTAGVTSDISGRGVGMDAVRTTSASWAGGPDDLRAGRGTVSQIRLPLTLAIMAALLVEVDGRPFAIPLDRIERTVRLADHAVRSVAAAGCWSCATPCSRSSTPPTASAARRSPTPATRSS